MFLNAPKLQLLDVLFLVIEDVLPECISFQDLHVGSEADHKAPCTFQRVNQRPENLFTILPLDVFFRQRKFLQQETLSARIELQGNHFVQRSRHPEDVRLGNIVLRGKLPRRIRFLDGMDTCHLEHPGLGLIHIIGPDVNNVGGEFYRLHQAVMCLIAMGRFILLQDHLPLMLDGRCQRLHIGRIRSIVDITGNAGAVI